eukprot:TRINITY_DN74895_c0_g1_i1.p1 TRINITY_DN74895_c0_g1~~TRINITY_DN74895_c0_g1_i1.p1  ORF type:complete len:780 (+),score=92.45 TRINITY_DN74895_c0_g1_i1:67-2406(+)
MRGSSRPKVLDEDVDDGSVRFDQNPRSSPRTAPKPSPRSGKATPRSANSPSEIPRDVSAHGDIWDKSKVRNSKGLSSPPGRSSSPQGRSSSPQGRSFGSSPAHQVYGNLAQSPASRTGSPQGSLNARRTLISSPRSADKRGPGGLYHEKQRQAGRHAALHCLNNLLQEPRISEEHLVKTAEQLDRAEQRLAGGRALSHANKRKDGFYNPQVLQAVLGGLGFEMQAVRGDVRVEGETGFVANKNRHWFAVRRLGTAWFDLNSCLPKPEHYDLRDLQEHLLNAQNQGYNIFVIRGEWPPCDVEENATDLDEAVRACLRDLGGQTTGEVVCTQELGMMADPSSLPSLYKIPNVWQFGAHWFGAARFQSHPDIQAKSEWQNTELAFKKKVRRITRKSHADASLEDEELGEADMLHVRSCGVDSPKSPEVHAGPRPTLDRIFLSLDANRDGVFNVDDLDDLVAADVDEVVMEDEPIILPIYIILQLLVVLGFWLVNAIMKYPNDILYALAGLESNFPGLTTVLVYRDCVSYRWDAWRWLTYQFTHNGVAHVGMNCFILVVAGLPLETFQGHWRTFLLFNAGVASGAMTSMVWNVRAELVGMSAGCYALLFVHFAELVMNWGQSRFRWPKVILLLAIVGLDVANIQLTQMKATDELSPELKAVSHSAHVGGAFTGLVLGIIFSRNLVVHQRERCYQLTALFMFAGFLTYNLAYIAEWPPRTFIDPEPWCWSGQVFNQSLFIDPVYHCVRCANTECIDRWYSTQRWVEPVIWQNCKYEAKWANVKP